MVGFVIQMGKVKSNCNIFWLLQTWVRGQVFCPCAKKSLLGWHSVRDNLGSIFFNGVSVKRDWIEAIKWFGTSLKFCPFEGALSFQD